MDTKPIEQNKKIAVLTIGTRVIVTTQDELNRIIHDEDELAELRDS